MASGLEAEALRTTLWLVPTLLTVAAAALFVVTYALDRAAYHGEITFPAWMDQGSADAGRQVLSAIAAGVITVAGSTMTALPWHKSRQLQRCRRSRSAPR
jgi:uncharacterized membrane protein